MNNRGVPHYLGVQHNMMRRVIVNRMLVAVSAPIPPVPQIPVRPTVPVYTYPSTYRPPPPPVMQQITRPWVYQQPLPSAPQGQYVTALLSVTDTEYLQYSDLMVDDFQYNQSLQSQVLSVDNSNYSAEYHQEYQQVQQVQHQYPQYQYQHQQQPALVQVQLPTVDQPQHPQQQQITYVTLMDNQLSLQPVQHQQPRVVSVSVADPVLQHQPAQPSQPAQPAVPIKQQVQQQAQQQAQLTPVSVSSSHNQLALLAPLPSANETISEPIQIFFEITNVPSGVPPTTSSPKEQ